LQNQNHKNQTKTMKDNKYFTEKEARQLRLNDLELKVYESLLKFYVSGTVVCSLLTGIICLTL
jgi:hypothetical protein